MGENRVDFVVIFALEKELSAFLKQIGTYEAHSKSDDDAFYTAEIARKGESQTYKIVILQLRRMGNYEAAAATTRAIDVWNPHYILVGGIAGGVRRRSARLGDILVAELVVAYEQGKKREAGVEVRAHAVEGSRTLVEIAERLEPKTWALDARVPRPGAAGSPRVIPRAHFGTILSGEKVVADAPWLKEVSVQARTSLPEMGTVIGVEMEGYGAALAASRATTAPGILIAKAICDWADAKKNDGWQDYAAAVSAAFLVAVMRASPFEPGQPAPLAHRVYAKPYHARSKLGLCERMGANWEDLADYWDIPRADREQFRKGRQCQDIWAWLELRKKLDGLPDALRQIKREDLLDELIPAESAR